MLLTLLATLIAIIGAAFLYLSKVKNITGRDWKFLVNGLKVKKALKNAVLAKSNTALLFASTLKRFGPQHPAIVFKGKTLTLDDVEKGSNQVAHFALEQKLAPPDTIALYMVNRPEYVNIWLGMSKIGVRSALINYNLKMKGLLHSLEVSQSKILIFGYDVRDNIQAVLPDITKLGLKLFVMGGKVDYAESLDEALARQSIAPVDHSVTAQARGVVMKDPILYIYTSGTTGLPKAAILHHARFFGASHAIATFFGVRSTDRLYSALPLYHAAGGVVGVGVVWHTGATLILAEKFSASRFWPEARENKATAIQYIGEVCRFTLAQPPNAEDKNSGIRLAIGNGLRPDIWTEFQTRFGIKRICEFYAATEGPAALLNSENAAGAIGFISPLVRAIFPSRIVKFDVEHEEVVRGANGLCIECKPGEAGEFLCRIENVAPGVSNFTGYTNAEASKKKIVNDVFKKGDAWFRSGDLLKANKDGLVYFVDRIGDTFRWKGENVSTLAVAEVLSTVAGCGQVTVYGVTVPNQDGRCGMAAIVQGGTVSSELQDENVPAPVVVPADLKALAARVSAELPPYSRPYFVRLLPEMEITGTFKFKKVDLRDAGYNPNTIRDPLFFLKDGREYVPLTPEMYAQIESGALRF